MTADQAIPDAEIQLNGLIFAACLLAPDQSIAQVNMAGEAFFGRSAKRLVGEPLTKFIHFPDPRIQEALDEQDAPLIARVVVADIGGAAREINITLSPIAGHEGWQVITLSDAKQNDFAGEEDRGAQVRAPAVLAHEIKNPLAGIRGAAQLLQRKAGEDCRDLTHLIASEVDRIASLVDRMQSLGRETSQPVEPCNLHEVVHHACKLTAAANGNRLKLIEEFDPSLPPIMANRDSLSQILINLLSNARDACLKEDRPEIEIRTRYVSAPIITSVRADSSTRLPIELRISDNGPGIAPELRDHIFEPFVSGKANGQGLGLALVAKLVREMDSRITHERDRERERTYFKLHLPVADLKEAA